MYITICFFPTVIIGGPIPNDYNMLNVVFSIFVCSIQFTILLVCGIKIQPKYNKIMMKLVSCRTLVFSYPYFKLYVSFYSMTAIIYIFTLFQRSKMCGIHPVYCESVYQYENRDRYKQMVILNLNHTPFLRSISINTKFKKEL